MNDDHDHNISEYEWAIATTPAPEPEDPPEVRLLYELEDIFNLAFPEALMPKAVMAITRCLETSGDVRGARCLKDFIDNLPNGKEARFIREQYYGANDSCRGSGKATGLSHEGYRKKSKRFQALFDEYEERKRKREALYEANARALANKLGKAICSSEGLK